MELINAGVSGKNFKEIGNKSWKSLKLPTDFNKIVELINPNSSPRPIQALAFGKYNILENRRNLIISAPTNSGKSLIAILAILNAVIKGKRAVLLEPLRAIAQEKFEEINKVIPKIQKILKRKITIRISTGDYRLDTEYFSSPPPNTGEIIIATPERFDVILRNPQNSLWIESIGLVCVDEAHLISSPKRGATLEYLITTMLYFSPASRLVLLSASLGDTKKAEEWLHPCDVIKVTERVPSLTKEVVKLSENEDANEIICNLSKEILSDSNTSLLVFVYQTKSTEILAQNLREFLKDLVEPNCILAYHSQMSSQKRTNIRQMFSSRHSRCLITTTSLALGVNLPCSHVIIRDCNFPGFRTLTISELLQMMGRAGRGNLSGKSFVIVRPNDKWEAIKLAEELKEEKLPDFCSSFDSELKEYSGNQDNLKLAVATQIAIQINRNGKIGSNISSLTHFFERSLGGKIITKFLPEAFSWICSPTQSLAYIDENMNYQLTTLAKKSLQSSFPLDLATNYSQLLKDIIFIDPNGNLLLEWKPIDHLTTLEMISSQPSRLRLFSAKLVTQVDGWMETNLNQSLLYKKWIRGDQNFSRSVEIAGSLNLSNMRNNSRKNFAEWSYQTAYLSVFRSIVLWERGQGISLEEIQRKWTITNLEEVEESWRDRNLWLLSGLMEILDLPCFYFHLLEECKATRNQVQKVKEALANMKQQVLDLLIQLKYCSPLGSFLHKLQEFYQNKSNTSVSFQTIQKLEKAGFTKVQDLLKLKEEDFLNLGIRKHLANQIIQYINQRMRI